MIAAGEQRELDRTGPRFQAAPGFMVPFFTNIFSSSNRIPRPSPIEPLGLFMGPLSSNVSAIKRSSWPSPIDGPRIFMGPLFTNDFARQNRSFARPNRGPGVFYGSPFRIPNTTGRSILTNRSDAQAPRSNRFRGHRSKHSVADTLMIPLCSS